MIRGILGRSQVLSRREQELRARERELLERLGDALERFRPDVAEEDLHRFQEAVDQLEGFFLLVVVGEFNSGKSTFINALLGEPVLPEGVTPTTDRINLLRHGEPGERTLEPFLVQRTHPLDLLREIHIVDTPGTNAVIRRHEELTREFIPRCDLVLFVTSADRPFTESERAFLEHVREWGKKIVFVVNRIDILSNDGERRQVVDYVAEQAGRLLDLEPEIFAVSSRGALQARVAADEEAWRSSGFGAVEHYLRETLDQEERVRLKLLNPLNVGLRLAARYKEVAFERLKALAEDLQTIERIDRRLTQFHDRMLQDLDPRLARLDVQLHDMEHRGMAFFDETVRIGRIKSLLDSDAVRRDFEHAVIGETPKRIESEIQEIVDWIVGRDLELWQDIQGTVEGARTRAGMETIGRRFDYNRQALLDSVGRLARDALQGYDREAESRAIANEVQGTFATTALAEAGAVGVGALVATAFAGAAADVTGFLLATLLAFGGFYLIPRRRREAKRRFHERVEEVRGRLRTSLIRQVHQEIERATARIEEAIEPYRRFVATQQERLHQARGELVAIEDALGLLKSEIEAR
ncbi:MAG: dynamin family protein [Gemmatimonadota bacterium]